MEHLNKDGVNITDKVETYDYGESIHILGIEGNKVEFWEPNDIVYDMFVVA